jgi:hypothetical protein
MTTITKVILFISFTSKRSAHFKNNIFFSCGIFLFVAFSLTAVAMAKFARDCRDGMNDVCTRLEKTLGPDTGKYDSIDINLPLKYHDWTYSHFILLLTSIFPLIFLGNSGSTVAIRIA